MTISELDWLAMCDTAIKVRRRLVNASYDSRKLGILISDKEATVLILAALEYSNRLAHEEGDRLAAEREKKTP